MLSRTPCVAINKWLEMSINHKISYLPENTIVEVFLNVKLCEHFNMKNSAFQILFKVQKDLDKLSVWSSIPLFDCNDFHSILSLDLMVFSRHNKTNLKNSQRHMESCMAMKVKMKLMMGVLLLLLQFHPKFHLILPGCTTHLCTFEEFNALSLL